MNAALSGFALGASLIVAIGAQNAFVLRQGLQRRFVFAVCLTCAASDALLIAAGAAGMGALVQGLPGLLTIVTLGGAVFLFAYGLAALGRALRPTTLQAGGPPEHALLRTLGICLGLTLLNPHVYLDTVILLGSLAARYEEAERLAYAGGAAAASFMWFFGLGYGARLLAPVFAKALAWRVLDLAIAAIMWLLAAGLLFSLL